MSENGKGDTPRPMSVDIETYKDHFDNTFGKKKTWWERKKEKEEQEERIQQYRALDELTQLHQEMGLYDIQGKESGSNTIG